MTNIRTNRELADCVKEIISDSGIKKGVLATRLNISRQALYEKLKKDSFSLDDANFILAALNMKLVANIQITSK